MLALVTLVIPLVSLAGCTTVRTRERPDPREDWVYTVRSGARRASEDLLYGELRYRGSVLPSYFSSVVIGTSRFNYSIRTPVEPFRGYRRDLDFELPADAAEYTDAAEYADAAEPGPENDTVDLFTRRDRNRGWYFGALHQRRRETPSWWIWVRRENLEAFLDPNRIEEFVRRYHLEPISPGVRARVEVRIQYSTQL